MKKLRYRKLYLVLALAFLVAFSGYVAWHQGWPGGAQEPIAHSDDDSKATIADKDADMAATITQEQGDAQQIAAGNLSNETHGWGIKPNQDHMQPEMPGAIEATLKQYDAFWVGHAGEKVLYLTFDEGYENGYTPKILDVLQENKVPAAFFVTGHFLATQPELVQRMVQEGHIVGNHTDTHPSLPDVSDVQIKKELAAVEAAYGQITDLKDMRYLRPPKGEYSQRTLATTRGLGYYNIFWSLALVDWVPMPGGAEQAYQGVMERLHPGAIILLHAVSKDNTEALDRILKDAKAKGYQFKSLDHLVGT